MNKLLRKKDYDQLKQFKQKLERSKKISTMSGYKTHEMQTMQSIFYKYGGDRTKKINSCRSCGMYIVDRLLKAMNQYEARYYKSKKL